VTLLSLFISVVMIAVIAAHFHGPAFYDFCGPQIGGANSRVAEVMGKLVGITMQDYIREPASARTRGHRTARTPRCASVGALTRPPQPAHVSGRIPTTGLSAPRAAIGTGINTLKKPAGAAISGEPGEPVVYGPTNS
jgi:hypothetical protein